MTLYEVIGERDSVLFEASSLDEVRCRALLDLDWTSNQPFAWGEVDEHGGMDTLLGVTVCERTDEGSVHLGEIHRCGPDLNPTWEYAGEENEGIWIEIIPATGELYRTFEVTISCRLYQDAPTSYQARQMAIRDLQNRIENGWIDDGSITFDIKIVNDNQMKKE